MLEIAGSVFIVLHGLVHLWYVVLSQRLIEVTPQMGWSGRSWFFSPALGDASTRALASALYVVATLTFVVGGAALIGRAEWARPLLTGAALLSSSLIVIFWEGGLEMWMEKGLLGLLINAVLLIALWGTRAPALTN